MTKYKIGLFTGAGISVPLGLPATNGFQKTIKSIDSQLLGFVKSHLQKTGSENDIEKILYVLEDFNRSDDFTKHLLSSNNTNTYYVQVNKHMDELRNYAKDSINKIKSDIYEILENYDLDNASLLYFYIIKELKANFPDSAISFFTTNYDLTFENGFAENEAKFKEIGINDINFGFSAPRIGKMVYIPSEEFNWVQDVIEYKKLHGSLDWTKDSKGNCVRSGVSVKPKEPGEMPLLYPGFKGIPSQQPFIDLHDCFYERLNQMDVLFVLGFAFRDQYLNNLFDFALKRNKDLRIVCYNPCEISDFPGDSMVKDFIKKYPLNFLYLKSAIKIEENPLNLEENINKLSKDFAISTFTNLIK